MIGIGRWVYWDGFETDLAVWLTHNSTLLVAPLRYVDVSIRRYEIQRVGIVQERGLAPNLHVPVTKSHVIVDA